MWWLPNLCTAVMLPVRPSAMPLASAIWRLGRFARAHAARSAARDVILTPVIGHPPPVQEHLATDVDFDTAMERILHHFPFTGILNATGEPALSLPLGRTARDLPIGVQLVGRVHQEALLLSLASEFEAAHPWSRIAPRRIFGRCLRGTSRCPPASP
jgi:amidase